MPPATKKSKKDSFPAAGGVHPIHAAPEAPQGEQPAPALEDDGLAQADKGAPSEGASASAMLPVVGGGLGESQLSAEGMGETPQPKTAAAELAELGRPEPAPKKARTEAVVPPRPAAGGSAPPVPTPITSADVISAGDGAADPVAKYIAETVDYVNYHLTRCLQHPPPGSKLKPVTAPWRNSRPLI